MNFSHDKQKGFVTPVFWVAVLIGLLSVTTMKSNEIPAVENSETYKQAGLKDTVRNEVTEFSITDE